MTVGFGIIGFLDDYLKVVLCAGLTGLLAWQKMLCQIVVTAVFAVYLLHNDISLAMLIPFSGGKYLSPVLGGSPRSCF